MSRIDAYLITTIFNFWSLAVIICTPCSLFPYGLIIILFSIDLPWGALRHCIGWTIRGKKQYSCWCHTRNSSRIFWSQFIGGIKIILCCCCKILYRKLHNKSVQFACQLPNLNKLVMSSRGWMNALLSSWQGVMGRASKTGCCYLCIYSKDEAAKSHIKILTNTFSRRPTEWNGLSDLEGFLTGSPLARLCRFLSESVTILWRAFCDAWSRDTPVFVMLVILGFVYLHLKISCWLDARALLSSLSPALSPPLIIIIII